MDVGVITNYAKITRVSLSSIIFCHNGCRYWQRYGRYGNPRFAERSVLFPYYSEELQRYICLVVGADFHKTMVATVPGEQLIGRRPVWGTGPAVRYQACFGAENYICSRENQQKLLPPELHFLTPICIRSSVCWGFGAPDPTGRAYSAPQIP